ncbi:uncharacterized protein IAS62_006556 [Cryptococcus decagattii]|uniref:2',3'-cyclic-nucleotide 3'-phosphodiesterase n=1 Tax=Cryptococcus decagattii TaxID=1859122 RepID=A0ABZ2B3D0_9TREE
MSDAKPKQSSSLSGYAVWLIPSADEKQHYQPLINRLTKLGDGRSDDEKSDSPSFEPHITLFAFIPLDTPIGQISDTLRQVVARVNTEASESSKAGATFENGSGLKDFVLGLLPAQSGTSYFQSVLAPVKPTATLLSLREQTVAAFSSSSLPPPSLSPLSDSLKKKGKTDDYFPHLSLFYGDCTQQKRDEIASVANKDDPTLGSGRARVTIKELGIVRCAGKVEEWEHVDSVVL